LFLKVYLLDREQDDTITDVGDFLLLISAPPKG